MTIISTDRKFIFIHLHKCGGTSVEKSYEKHALFNDVIVGSTEMGEEIQKHYFNKYGIGKHSDADSIIKLIGVKRWKEFHTYAIVRNPFSVYESLYKWINGIFRFHSRKHNIDYEQLKYKISLNSTGMHFEKWGSAQAFANSNDFSSFIQYAIDYKILPTMNFTKLLNMHNNDKNVKYIYKLEEIDKLWDSLSDKLGVSLDKIHANKSSYTQNEKLKWNDSHIKYLKNIYNEELIVFNYDIPPFHDT